MRSSNPPRHNPLWLSQDRKKQPQRKYWERRPPRTTEQTWLPWSHRPEAVSACGLSGCRADSTMHCYALIFGVCYLYSLIHLSKQTLFLRLLPDQQLLEQFRLIINLNQKVLDGVDALLDKLERRLVERVGCVIS